MRHYAKLLHATLTALLKFVAIATLVKILAARRRCGFDLISKRGPKSAYRSKGLLPARDCFDRNKAREGAR